MTATIENLLTRYDRKEITRTTLVQQLTQLGEPGRVPAAAAPLQAVGINHIAIGVSDLVRSVAWYCQLFGLRIIQQTEESALLGWGDGMLVLRPDPQPGTISHFMFGVEDYDSAKVASALKQHGLEPQQDSDSFHVRDPDGLNLQVGDRHLGLSRGIAENGFVMR